MLQIRLGGNDQNSGGFVAGGAGTDYSQQDAAQYALTNGSATTGSATITTTSASSDMVDNLAYVAGGTGTIPANWYRIVSQVTGTSITLDRSTGLVTGTGVTLNIGGALATYGVLNNVADGIGGVLVTGNIAYIKYNASPYTITTSTVGPGGPLNSMPGIALRIIGFDVTPGDNTGNRPTLKWTATAPGAVTAMLTINNTLKVVLGNLIFDANSVNNVGCVATGGFKTLSHNCRAQNFNGTGAVYGFTSSGHCVQCTADTGNTGFNTLGSAYGCTAKSCTTGFGSVVVNVKGIARSCTSGYTSNQHMMMCLADACTTLGISLAGAGTATNCIATNCTGSGKGFDAGASVGGMKNCAVYNNATHVNGTPIFNDGMITLSADPFVSQSTGDYRINGNNPGGFQLQAAGLGVIGQVDDVDINALQHVDSGPCGGYIAMP